MIIDSNDYLQSAAPPTDGFTANSSPFLPAVNEPPPPQTFHFNPTITNQPTASGFVPNSTSDFVHHPNVPNNEPLTRKLVTPPPPPAPVVKGPIPSEHQIIQDTFDLLVSRCQQATQQLPLKRKLEEVKKKLDVLYDKLRENKVNSFKYLPSNLIFFVSSRFHKVSYKVFIKSLLTFVNLIIKHALPSIIN